MAKMISAAMHRHLSEVHKNTPSTVPSSKKGAAKQKMLFAIAASKTRKAGGSVYG